jgi:hypothetical protein
MPQFLDYVGLPQVPINYGDTTPVPDTSGSLAYSTTLHEVLVWTGAYWQPASNINSVQENTDVANMSIGCPVYLDTVGGGVKQAIANSATTRVIFGLVLDATLSINTTGNIITKGFIKAPTAAWDIITGGSGGLVVGTYYLSDSVTGNLTTTAPTTTGSWVVKVGVATNATNFMLNPSFGVRL